MPGHRSVHHPVIWSSAPIRRPRSTVLKLKTGWDLFIRPVKPEDVPLFTAFIDTLSDTTIYYRFFRHIKRFTRQQIYRFTTIDYDRQVALIALSGSDSHEKMHGVIRIIGHPDGKKADFYIVVSDADQGRGIGAILLEAGLARAFDQGYETICAVVLPENDGMKKLARKLGFEMEFDLSDRVFDVNT